MHYYVTKQPSPAAYLTDRITGISSHSKSKYTIVEDQTRNIAKLIRNNYYFTRLSILSTTAKLNLPEISQSKFLLDVAKLPASNEKYKQTFVDSLSKFMKVVPYETYKNNYSASFVHTSAVIFDNKDPRWLSMSIICTRSRFVSTRFCTLVAATASTVASVEAWPVLVKSGFFKIDFSDITSVAKTNEIVKQLIQYLLVKIPAISEEITLFRKAIPSCDKKKKVRFSSKVYYGQLRTNVKFYKNGKPMGILKRSTARF